jgi:hypothetical protein
MNYICQGSTTVLQANDSRRGLSSGSKVPDPGLLKEVSEAFSSLQ